MGEQLSKKRALSLRVDEGYEEDEPPVMGVHGSVLKGWGDATSEIPSRTRSTKERHVPGLPL
jgi:hypothetical protein